MTAAVERVFNGREPPEARKPRKDSDRRWERLGQWPSSLPREEREQVGELVRLEALQQSVRHERPGTGRVAFDVVRRHAASLGCSRLNNQSLRRFEYDDTGDALAVPGVNVADAI